MLTSDTGGASSSDVVVDVGGLAQTNNLSGETLLTVEEVSKHSTKNDCWIVVGGQVLNVSNFLSSHPGGELAVLTFAGKDATEEFSMIHPPVVIQKYAPDTVIGMLGSGVAKLQQGGVKGTE